MPGLLLRPLTALLVLALSVSPNGHFLQSQDGRPFFWLGDTAWLLLGKLDRADTARYLDDRQRKGFTVIQTVILWEADQRTVAGVPALIDRNPATPQVDVKPGEYGYWQHLDWVVDQAAQRGMYMGLLPTWGSLVKKGELNMATTPSCNFIVPATAKVRTA